MIKNSGGIRAWVPECHQANEVVWCRDGAEA